jgi:HAMP domain-containing protein
VDTEALALAVPTDGASGGVPVELTVLAEGAAVVLEAAMADEVGTEAGTVQDMLLAWTRTDAADVPRLVNPIMSEALHRLASAVEAGDPEAAAQAAIEVGQSAFDLQLRYRPVTDVDAARFDLWLSQLQLDAAAADADAVNGDLLTLDYVRERFVHVLDADAAAALNLGLEALQVAVNDLDLGAAAAAARDLQDVLGGG